MHFSVLEMQLQQLMVFIATVEILAGRNSLLCITVAVELKVAKVTCLLSLDTACFELTHEI